MKGFDYILAKQVQWAKRKNIALIGSKVDRGFPAYTNQLDENLLAFNSNGLLPDYKASTGVKVAVDDMAVQLCRSDGSNNQCVSVNKNESSTIIQQQGNVTVKNRVNSGNGTLITLKQN